MTSIQIQQFTNSTERNAAMKQLKNDYVKARAAMRESGQELGSIKLTYKEATALHIDRRVSHDVTAIEHTMKSLFFLAGGTCNCEGDEAAEVDSVCYRPMRRTASGFLLPMVGLQSVELIAKTLENSDYSKQWQAIANSMRKHGINPKVVEAIEAHLRGKTPHIMGFQNYWKRTDKPKTLSFADVLRSVTGWPVMESGKSYPHKEWQKIHTDHINARAIEAMKSRASQSKYGDYKHYKQTHYGQKRDRSVSIQVYDDGRVDYYAASEFAGCGNGDYYMMYSPTMAFYAESD